jgi:hypothetical protein
MLSAILRSKSAIRVNVEIIRTFVRLRGMMASHEVLARKIAVLERKYDAQFRTVFEAIRQPTKPPRPRVIGFHARENGED